MAPQFADWSKLPDEIDFHDGHWSWGWGGYGTHDNQCHIVACDDEGQELVYVLPNWMASMLGTTAFNAKERTLSNVRDALGL